MCSQFKDISKNDPSQILYLSDLQLTELPVLPDTLHRLYCGRNKLTGLPVLPSSLNVLNCRDNLISILPKLPESLQYLHCHGNLLTSLPKLPKSLESFVWLYNYFCWNISRSYFKIISVIDNRWINQLEKYSWNNYKILNKIRRRFNKRKRRRIYLHIKNKITNDLAGVVVKYV